MSQIYGTNFSKKVGHEGQMTKNFPKKAGKKSNMLQKGHMS
jgi:hypothetical protein